MVKRSEKCHNKLKENVKIAKKACRKRHGKCKASVGMDGEHDTDDYSDSPPPQPKKKRAKFICPLCENVGHKTKRSKECLYHKENNTTQPQAGAQQEQGPLFKTNNKKKKLWRM